MTKNFLLTNEVSIDRKIKEAILSLRMERAFSKDQILGLYLNEIYLGFGSYGVAAAALNYFDKALDQLTLDEMAYLAALPKAPANYHPIRRPENARARRNWVLAQMVENGFISDAEARRASAQPITVATQTGYDSTKAPFFAEEVRRDIVDKFGEDMLYTGGLSVGPRLTRHCSTQHAWRWNAGSRRWTVARAGVGRWQAMMALAISTRFWPGMKPACWTGILPRLSPR